MLNQLRLFFRSASIDFSKSLNVLQSERKIKIKKKMKKSHLRT